MNITIQLKLWLLGSLSLLCACSTSEPPQSNQKETALLQGLEKRAADNLNSETWNLERFQEDKKMYAQYKEAFSVYPLNCSPFPVAEYEYAVASMPFSIQDSTKTLKGICVGEFATVDSEEPQYGLTIVVVAQNETYSEDVFVQSRNYPYLTAQGIFASQKHHFDWVYAKSPDGFSFCFVNMKLFDLRFGETIVLFPEAEGAFSYQQIRQNPHQYKSLDAFKAVIADTVQTLLLTK